MANDNSLEENTVSTPDVQTNDESTNGFQAREDSPYSPEAQKEIYKLRRENADRRVRAKDIQDQLDEITAKTNKIEEAKLLEEGKYKDLLEKKEMELLDKTNIKSENDNYKIHFEKELEKVLETIDGDHAQLIKETEMSLVKKVEWANVLAAKNNTLSQSNSPDSNRPGGDASKEPINLNDYSGPQGRAKLNMLLVTNPTRFAEIMSLKEQQDQ